MKKLTTIAIVLMMLIISCEEERTDPKYRIEQVVSNYGESNDPKFHTYVWKELSILKVWADDIETTTDSLKQARKLQAKKFIDKCKQLER